MEPVKNKFFEVKNLTKTFFSDEGYFTAVEDVSFDVREGEFLVLLGPGRCGSEIAFIAEEGLRQIFNLKKLIL